MIIEITIARNVAKQLPLHFRKRAIKQLVIKISRAIKDVDLSRTSLSLLITDDKQIAELNAIYRHKSKPTDVLSFPAANLPFCSGQNLIWQRLSEDQHSETRPLGDIVISVETAANQARSFGVTFEDEIARLLVHGILHLLGYEHEKVPSHIARRMRQKEGAVLKAVGEEK